MYFPVTAPLVKKAFGVLRVCVAMKAPVGLLSGERSALADGGAMPRQAPQSATNAKLKMIFPLKMPRAKRRAFPIIFYTKSPPGIAHGGLWFTIYSALVSGFASALASGFAAGAAAGAAGFTTGFGGLGSSFSGNRMMCLGHFWAHIPQPLHLS